MPDYPRIWDRCAERKIIGETRVSWLVDSGLQWRDDPIKVNKKRPNREHGPMRWFFNIEQRDLEVWADQYFNEIKNAMGRHARTVDAEKLRRVAEVIGFKPLPEVASK